MTLEEVNKRREGILSLLVCKYIPEAKASYSSEIRYKVNAFNKAIDRRINE